VVGDGILGGERSGVATSGQQQKVQSSRSTAQRVMTGFDFGALDFGRRWLSSAGPVFDFTGGDWRVERQVGKWDLLELSGRGE